MNTFTTTRLFCSSTLKTNPNRVLIRKIGQSVKKRRPYITRFRINTAGIKVAAKSSISFFVPKFVFINAAICFYYYINLAIGFYKKYSKTTEC